MGTNDEFKLTADMAERMFEGSRDIILIISADTGKILKANREAVNTYGYSVEELLEMTVYQLRHSESSKLVESQIHTASGEGLIFETIHYRKDGSSLWVEVSAVNIASHENILMSTIRDITQRKEKEIQLMESEVNFRRLYDSMSQGVALHEIMLDENEKPINYKFLKVNKSFEKIIGLNSEQIIGRTVLDILPNTESFWIEEYGNVALTGESKSLRNYSQELERYFSVDVYSPQKRQFAVLVTDITEAELREKQLRENYEELTAVYEELTASEEELKSNYKEMEVLKEEAESANRAKTQFLANMSHEIRTPLNGVAGMAQLLEMTSVTREQKEYIDMLRQSAEQLLQIIDDILDISKIEAGKLQLSYEPFNLKDNLDKLIKMYAINGSKKNVDVMLYYQPLLEEGFIGDVIRLNQVLVNLLENAVKFTEEGTVLLTVRKVMEYNNKVKLKFVVKDTGIGISKDFSNRLFKLFNQGDSSYTKKYGGTGLGLAISKELVAKMKGEIWYESDVNKGTTFYFTIELDKQCAEAGVIKSKEAESIIDNMPIDKVILIVEDNEINQRLVCKYIEQFGYRSMSATDGIEALELYEKEKFDLILMDIQMPQMNGFEVTEKIREKEKFTSRHIPIIAMTAYAMKGDMEKCTNAGMDDYISKPLNRGLLEEKIRNYLR